MSPPAGTGTGRERQAGRIGQDQAIPVQAFPGSGLGVGNGSGPGGN